MGAGGELDRASAAHVLRRVGFGAPPVRVERAMREGLEATLRDLERRRDHEPALTGRAAERLASLGDPETLQARWMALILGDGAPLLERVTLMWHGHFATSNAKVGDLTLMHRQNELFREHGLGDFRALLHRVARDPAMLLWLDGDLNRVGAPNENFAREVMELFALGIEGGYTEGDIQEAARAFTGWSVRGRRFAFREEHHDGGEKRLFGRGGVRTGEEAIDRVLEHPSCPRWIARRLLTTFLAPEPADGLIERYAGVLVEEGWRIGDTLGRLFRDAVFLGEEARRSRIRGPVELIADAVLGTGAEVAPLDAARAAARMGQALFAPPSVEGWEGGRAWIDPGTWLARHNWLVGVALGGGFDAAEAFGRHADAAACVDAVTRALLPDGVDPALRRTLVDAAGSADSPERAAAEVCALVLTSPEYHLA